MFSGSILQDTQAAKDKLLAVQERHGEFMKVSHILGVIFTQYRLDNTRMTHHVHSFRNRIALLIQIGCSLVVRIQMHTSCEEALM